MARRAQTSPTEEVRRIINCTRCHLVQYETRTGYCRRCGLVLPLTRLSREEGLKHVRSILTTNFKGYRQAAGLSPRDIVERGGISRSTVQRLESGAAISGLIEVEKAAEGLGVPLHWLLEPATEERCTELFAVSVLRAVQRYGVRKEAVLYGIGQIVEKHTLRKAG